MKNPKVSVIMPVYNAEMYVEKTINGILSQTFSDFELILIDDLPTDSTMTIIEGIKDDRIRIIHNEKNMGIAQSRNIGLKAARGQYIALMDDDDLTADDRFEKEVAYLDAHSEIGVVGGNVVTIDAADNVISPTANMINNPAYLWLDIVFQCPMANGSTMFRRELITEHNLKYEDNMLGMEDYNFWIEASFRTQIYNFNEVFLKWRTRAGSETTRVRSKKQEERRKKFAEIQVKALVERGVTLEDEEWKLFCDVYSEYKDFRSYDIKDLYIVMRKIQQQLLSNFPERTESVTYVLRNRFLEAARRIGYTHMTALGDKGFSIEMPKNAPLVSVVIPTHNREDKLECAVKSVLNQTYPNIEVLICDDASTDRTQEVGLKLSRDYRNVAYFRSEKNQGPAITRNLGAERAVGKYVAFHDDDDEWNPDKLSLQMYKMLNDDGLGMTFGQMARYRGDAYLNTVDEFLDWVNVRDDFFQAELIDNYVGTPSIVIRKDVFDSVGGFSKEVSTIEDWEFVIRVTKDNRTEFLNTALVDVHVGDGSVTFNVDNYVKTWCYIIKHYCNYATNRDVYIKRMIEHLRGNLGNGNPEDMPLYCTYIKKELVPQFIYDSLVVDYLIDNSKDYRPVVVDNNQPVLIDKFQRYKAVAIMLMNPEKEIAKWLEHNGYHRIGIYGVGRLGKCLIDRLSDTNICVDVLIDRKSGKYLDKKIYTQNEFLKTKTNVDAIIITPLYEATGIASEIRNKSNVKCLSIEDLCR